mmetsp:Transcript_12284/g.42813  ORF Transcript_12284/g.42813 Transcript_12284/m.42813 type:complete len:84 (+) Transcript_12284:956-1207(+)
MLLTREICNAQNECYQIMCRIPSSLQIAAISIFIILMLNNVPGMFRHAQISLFTSFQRGTNANDKNIRIPGELFDSFDSCYCV